MLSAFATELTGLLFTLKRCHILDGFSFNISHSPVPPPNAVVVMLATLLTAIEDCHGELRSFLCLRQERLSSQQGFSHEVTKEVPQDRMMASGAIFRPFTAKTDVNLGESAACREGMKLNPSSFQAVNLKVDTGSECLEAVNLSVAPSPSCLEALNLSVATSPSGLNLSVATSPCFHTADVNVGTTTDFKTLLDVGTSTECWDHVNLDVASSSGYFEPVNLHTGAAVGFTHDGDIFSMSAREDLNPSLCFDLVKEDALPQMTPAESVALSVLEELPLVPVALDLSQAAANFFVPVVIHEEAEKIVNNPTGPSQTVYSCNECGRGFRWRKSLRRHVRTHGEGRFLCHVCGKSCSEAWQLQKHEASHVGGNLICMVCGRRCVDKAKLRRHFATHRVGEYLCSICKKAFTRADLLKRHIQITHLKIRQFLCLICSKEFSTKSNLVGHKNSVHGGESIKCDKCGKKCKNKATYRIHMKTHDVPALACQLCGKKFHRKVQFHNHMQNNHASHLKRSN